MLKGSAGFLVFVFLVFCSVGWCKRPPRDVVVESTFVSGQKPDGWTIFGDSAKFQDAPGRFHDTLSALGEGLKDWYFSAPPKFLGDKLEAYGGSLEFEFGHATQSGKEIDRTKVWGLILKSSAAGLELGAKVRLGENKIAMVESDWTVLKGSGRGHNPSHKQLLVVLANLSQMLVRGDYFSEFELTWIDEVRFTRGQHDLEKLKRKARLDKRTIDEKGGVGLVLGYTTAQVRGTEKRTLVVKKIVEGGPAHVSGMIEVGDLILTVDGVDMGELTLRGAAEYMAGDLGTEVRLSMVKPSGGFHFVETLVRSKVSEGRIRRDEL